VAGENNRIFIEAYGLQEELTPEVPLHEITLTCNPYYRYKKSIAQNRAGEFPLDEALEQRLLADTMREFISYAVGCMFGRYSLDKAGLILANQGETVADYLRQIPEPSFMPDKDNVLPILEGEWFEDDIVSRFQEFLKISFGKEQFAENLAFIEGSLGKSIRNYFLKDFYDDHVKRYKKRPIYWLFSSPRSSFKALIYMHRYSPNTVSIILNVYLREYVFKLKGKTEQLEQQKISSVSTQKEKITAGKDLDRISGMIRELENWEKDTLYDLALKKLEIELDDGVKVNYLKFGKALKRIAGLEK
jgi:type II restriction/modification system DNA methylase subunit YeeA